MVLYGEELTDGFVPDKSQQSENSNSGSHVSENIPNDEIFVLQSDKEQNPPPRVPDEAPPKSESAVNGLPLNQEVQCSSLIVLPEKALDTPKTPVMPLEPVSKRSTPSITPEKLSDDGYNWRKYGQKIVKGDYVRSYYRCTYSNCLVKKQLERANDGQIADIVYFGEHDHPRPQRNIPVAVGFVESIVDERRDKPLLSTAEDESVDKQNQRPIEADTVVTPQISNVVRDSCAKVALVQSNHIRDEVCDHHDPDSKRQKKDRGNLDTTSWDKPTSLPRFVVQIPSEVDIVNDGYRWRKYGQKLVKGNPNPRSYYRCTNPGCPVKKHVERASYDSKVVITTYEGQHVHDMPPTRTVTHNTAGTSMFTTAHYDSSSTKSEGNAVSHDLVAHDMLDHENKLNEELNGASKATSGMVDITGSDMVSESRSCPESKPDEQQKGKSDEEEIDPIDIEIHHSSGLEGELKDHLNGDSRNTSEANNVCLDAVVHDNLGPERSISELQKPNAEPIQS